MRRLDAHNAKSAQSKDVKNENLDFLTWSAVCLLSADCFGGCRYTNVLQIRMPLPPDIWRWVGTIVQMFDGGLGQLSSESSSTTATNGQLSSKSSSTTATLPPTFGGHLYRDFEPICVKKLSTDIFDILCGRSLREFLLLLTITPPFELKELDRIE